MTGTGSQWLWYVSRGSGLVLLVVLSLAIFLGTLTRLGATPLRLQRFVVAELHRTLALFAVGLLALHVTTAMLDPYVSIGWIAAAVPGIAHYRPLAIGLGALAVDLGGAVLLTSVFRQRLGYRAWRVVHWLAYAAWPAAFLHSLGAGGDLGIAWVALLEWGAAVLVGIALVARLLARVRPEAALPR
ncbi:MAG: ferric reductase-like transmembrane domain-containing protein [Acidimicrobiales bacterium]|jgi:sulfoxide reductase heme-binding subunit YedZ